MSNQSAAAPSAPPDLQWRMALAGYMRDDKELLEKGTPEQIVAKLMERLTQDHWDWRNELTRYVPELSHMSFIGAKTTVTWVMNQLGVKPKE